MNTQREEGQRAQVQQNGRQEKHSRRSKGKKKKKRARPEHKKPGWGERTEVEEKRKLEKGSRTDRPGEGRR